MNIIIAEKKFFYSQNISFVIILRNKLRIVVIFLKTMILQKTFIDKNKIEC